MLLPFLLTACSNDDEPGGDTREKRVIEFAQPFVNHVSRTDIGFTKDNLTEFTVYGYVHRPDSYIFEGETVRKQSDGKWLCDRAEYWYPGNTYYFTGIAPVDSKSIHFTPALKGTGTMPGGGSISYNVNISRGKEDLIYAFETVYMPKTLPKYIKQVEMKFNHLLSKVEFEFYNDLKSPNYFININWLQIDNVYGFGTIDKAVSGAKWVAAEDSVTWIGVGQIPYIHIDKPVISAPVFLLPVYRNGMSVMFKTQVFESKEPFGNEGFMVTHEEEIRADFPITDLQGGRSYKIICHLNPDNVEGEGGPLRPISFTIEEKPWGKDLDVETTE